VLVLDEPTASFFDVRGEEEVYQRFLELAARADHHRHLAPVLHVRPRDRIVVLDQGKGGRGGTHRELCGPAAVCAMYNLQASRFDDGEERGRGPRWLSPARALAHAGHSHCRPIPVRAAV